MVIIFFLYHLPQLPDPAQCTGKVSACTGTREPRGGEVSVWGCLFLFYFILFSLFFLAVCLSLPPSAWLELRPGGKRVARRPPRGGNAQPAWRHFTAKCLGKQREGQTPFQAVLGISKNA